MLSFGLSFGQRRLWALQQLAPDSTAYNVVLAEESTDPVELPTLRRIIDRLTQRHEQLATRFAAGQDGEPAAEHVADFQAPITWLTTTDATDATWRTIARTQAEVPFDLAAAPPVRVVAVRRPASLVILLVMHHIVTDGWSQGLLQRDLRALYQAERTGAAADLPDIAMTYAEHAAALTAAVGRGRLDGLVSYWQAELAGFEVLDLPVDHARRNRLADSAATFEFALTADTTDQLHTLAKAGGFLLSSALLAAFTDVLSSYGGTRDVTVGVVLTGRDRRGVRDVVGFFANTVPLRVVIPAEATFSSLAKQTQAKLIAARQNQHAPLEQVVSQVAVKRDPDRNPLFDILVVHHGDYFPVPEVTGFRRVEWEDQVSGFDLTFDTMVNDGAVTGVLTYRTALFEPDTIARLGGILVRRIERLTRDPDRPLRDLRRLDGAGSIVRGPSAPATAPATVPDAFAATARAHPRQLALVENETGYTYECLDAWTDRMAALLADHGVRSQDVVAAAMTRSAAQVAAILAIWKAGAAVMLVDLETPAERIRGMLTDAAVAIVLTSTSDHSFAHPTLICPPLKPEPEPSPEPENKPKNNRTSKDAAYVLFTSGSTGRPKGVVVEHGALANLYADHVADLYTPHADRLGRRLRAGLTSSVAFGAVWNGLLALVAGHELHLISQDLRRDPLALARHVNDTGIDYLDLTPSYAAELVANGLISNPATAPSLLVIAGEALGRALADDLARCPTVRGYNYYGPTEYTVDATRSPITAGAPIRIGQPIWNTSAYVLDEDLNPVPVGVPGELYLAGAQLARGYINQPGLTASRFIPDPIGPPGTRMYRTGDRARLTPTGEIEYLARLDNQVKINGYRIELQEIEAVIGGDRNVQHVAVTVQEGPGGRQRLVAYVAERDGAVDIPRLRRMARNQLPAYMVPSIFVPMARLPLTTNGKVDAARLPEPDAGTGSHHTAPRDERESAIRDLFAEVLSQPANAGIGIGIDDDFFELGGDSLLAARLINRVRSVIGAPLSIRDVFETPTVAALAAKLGDAADSRPPLVAGRRPSTLPLSDAQRRLWFMSKLDAYRSSYNVPMAVQLTGPLDPDALQAALADVAARHEVLRTIYPDVAGVPHQVVLDNTARTPVLHRLDAPADLEELLAAESAYEFELASEIPIRTMLIRLAPDEHVLSVVMHHIATDGWSSEPFWRDLAQAYAARLAGSPPQWAPLPIQYADYALWQRRAPAEVAASQLQYWRDTLAGSPTAITLPADQPFFQEESMASRGVHARLNAGVHARLLDIGLDCSATLFMLCTAALAAMLTRMGAGQDLPLGTAVSGRADPVLDNVIGCFLNTVVLRVDADGDPTFTELLGRVKDVCLGAFDHQDVPFEHIVEALQPSRAGAGNPLFEISISCERAASGGPELAGTKATELPWGTSSARFELSFEFIEQLGDGNAPDGIDCYLEYRTGRFTQGRASRLLDCLLTIFAQAAAAPERSIGEFDILTPAERATYRPAPASPQASPADGPTAETLAGLFYTQARLRPDAVAIRWPAGQLSYADLNARSNRLARYLAGHGAGPGERVAVVLPRGPGYVTAVVAVAKTGAAFVPIDVAYPAERRNYLLEDVEPVITLTADVHCADYPATDLPPLARPADCAYVMYTSGSTGRPKGVMISNSAIVNLLNWSRRIGLIGPEGVMLVNGSISFDVSVLELWTALAAGASVLPSPDQLAVDLPELVRYLAGNGATHVHFVPTQLAEVLPLLEDRALPGGRALRILCGGEPLSADLARRLGEVWNFYGPTETAILATAWHGDGAAVAGRTAPIGTALDNVRTYVLDAARRPVPTGVRGELYVAGAQLAIGYLNRPELTAKRFVDDPFGAPGDRMYRTGDVVRRLDSGDLEFLGRIDDQVKIRGHRIEPGEVEAEIMRTGLATQAAVVARDDQRGDKQLVAYVVPAEPGFEVRALRERLRASLPAHLLPGEVVALDRLPLTANGKLDKAALPSPERERPGHGRGPRTPSEEIVRDVFAEVLRIDGIGIDDDFFELGGHSLLATRIAAGIKARLGVPMPVHTIFRASSVATLVAALELGSDGSSFEPVLPIRGHGDRAPLFCVHPITGLSWCYSGLAKHVPAGVPLIGLQAPNLAGATAWPGSFGALASACAASIRLIQPDGPYRLLGWSFGGNLAHAIAVTLQRDGAGVSLLALLDSYPDAGQDDEQVTDVIDAQLTDGALGGLAGDHLDRIRAVAEHNARLLSEYVPGVFGGDAVLVRATGSAVDAASHLGQWSGLIDGKIISHDVAGGHFDLMRPGPLGQIAGHLASWL